MATEFNYVANIDTTRIMGAVAEIRSQIGMAFGSATGFAGPAMGLAGGGFAGDASATAAQMLPGFGRFTPSMFGGTFTNAAMAYTPHYGMMQAETSFGQEQRVFQGGLGAAAQMAPPGVSPAEYFIGSEANRISRDIEARHQAQFAARSTFYSGVGGLAAGEVAGALAAPVGAAVGGRVASRLFGGGAAGAGKFVGGLAAGWMAFDWAMDEVGGRIQDHFANVERIGGITRELGELAGAGRGLGRTQRYDLGVAARQAAGDIKMDVQEMGDILALGRNLGMMPNATDPSKAREQFREFARAIDEGAQVLHTSLAGAAQVIKTATSHGMTAQEGVIRAAAMGGPGAFSRYMAFGDTGGRLAEANLLSREQGFGLFTGAIGAISGAGMSGAEMRMMGGKYGAAAMMGQTQMAAAMSPMGDMQLMAAIGGEGLGGMMDLPGQAMAVMGEGGDFIGNAIRFQTHKREMLRGVGARGLQTMARNQLGGVADMLMELSPTLSEGDAQQFAAMQMYGLNEVQAKAYVRGLGRGGGGGGGLGGAGAGRALVAMQGAMLGDVSAPAVAEARGFGFGEAAMGAALGGISGAGIPGALVGGAIGFVSQNWGALTDLFSGDHPSLFASAEEKADFYQRQQASAYDRRMAAAKSRVGYLDLDPDVAGAVYQNNLGGTRLNLDAMGSSGASARIGATLMLGGLGRRGAGAGSAMVGGRYYSSAELQERYRELGKSQKVTEDQSNNVLMAAGAAASHAGVRDTAKHFKGMYELATGLPSWMQTPGMAAFTSEQALGSARRLVGMGTGPGREAILKEMDERGVSGPLFREFYSKLTHEELAELNVSFEAGRALTGGAQGAQSEADIREGEYLSSAISVRGNEGATLGLRQERAALVLQRNRHHRQLTGRMGADMDASMGHDVIQQRYNQQIADIDEQLSRTTVDSDLYISKLRGSTHYAEAKAEIYRIHEEGLTGKRRDTAMARAQQMIGRAEAEARTYLPEGASVSAMDIDRTRWRRTGTLGETVRQEGIFWGTVGKLGAGALEAVTGVGEVRRRAGAGADVAASAVGEFFGGGLIGQAAERATATALKAVNEQSMIDKVSKGPLGKLMTTSWAQEVLTEAAALGPTKPKRKRRRGAGTLTQTVGWGARENAMDSINKSLRHTERMLSNLDKKISGAPPNPAAPSPGTGNTTQG